jgi:hypothetical protein
MSTPTEGVVRCALNLDLLDFVGLWRENVSNDF